MKLSLPAPDLSGEFLMFAAQFGMTHVRAMVEWFLKDGRGPANADAMRRAQDKVNAFGVHIGGALIPQAKGSPIWHIRLGGPEREQEIRDVCRTLQAMGKAEIRVAECLFNIQAVHGVGPHEEPDRAGRRGATQVWFDYGRVKVSPLSLLLGLLLYPPLALLNWHAYCATLRRKGRGATLQGRRGHRQVLALNLHPTVLFGKKLFLEFDKV